MLKNKTILITGGTCTFEKSALRFLLKQKIVAIDRARFNSSRLLHKILVIGL